MAGWARLNLRPAATAAHLTVSTHPDLVEELHGRGDQVGWVVWYLRDVERDLRQFYGITDMYELSSRELFRLAYGLTALEGTVTGAARTMADAREKAEKDRIARHDRRMMEDPEYAARQRAKARAKAQKKFDRAWGRD